MSDQINHDADLYNEKKWLINVDLMISVGTNKKKKVFHGI